MNIMRSIILLILPFSVWGQVTISDGTSMAIRGIFATSANISNSNSDNTMANLAEARLYLLSSSPQQIITKSRVGIGNLTVMGGGEKTVSGEWEITNSLHLEDGLLTPSSSGKIIFSLRTEAQQSITTDPNLSFVNGPFYSKGEGLRTFPIGFKNGTENIHAPVVLVNGSNRVETGIRIVNGDAGIPPTADLEEILQTRYWEIEASEAINSNIILSTNGMTLPAGEAFVVVQSSSLGGTPENLKGALQTPFVTSERNVTKPIVAIGIPRVFDVRIHDLITPNNDGANDELFIENIGLAQENTVTLLDRWGVVHKEWKKYDNTPDPKFFEKLSSGNYICVIEYTPDGTSEKKKLSQMVTVLRTN